MRTCTPARDVSVVPNAVPGPRRSPAHRERAIDLLFVGNLSYAPNVEAGEWLCSQMRPLLSGGRGSRSSGAPPVPRSGPAVTCPA